MSEPIIITIPSFVKYESDTSKMNIGENLSNGRKRRLNLTWEERIQRKKLKNRVAAQTSRDRKKAQLEELTVQVTTLQAECDRLKSLNEKLLYENSILHRKLSEQTSNSTTIVSSELLNRPAVSITTPLQQENASELAVVAEGKVKNQKSISQRQNLLSVLAVLTFLISYKSSNQKNALKALPTISCQEPSSMTLQRILHKILKHPKLKWSLQHGLHQNGWNIQHIKPQIIKLMKYQIQ
ncbi:X-box-binding protein 1-like [Ctenocephalides felis]|uniref:X-box-binding protein 1-like n=1 Tax=Ctenocephalides felis TaxID=7515 RepID=UPI000E6E19C2|nr:X-box-binding protein 1-like [Ctenocephalides felis]